MIDSLFGLIMLLLLSGWMAELLSVQAKLTSTSTILSPREQIDYLSSISNSNDQQIPCKQLVSTAKSLPLKRSLQILLLSSHFMMRPDGQSLDRALNESQSLGELPYHDPESENLLLPVSGSAKPFPDSFIYRDGDWWYASADVEPGDLNSLVDLNVCQAK